MDEALFGKGADGTEIILYKEKEIIDEILNIMNEGWVECGWGWDVVGDGDGTGA